ncbi:phage gene 29 protein family protein [Mycolicibacterium psychrotolerans]|uniref:phage gene 29 protein family protein n=1 Tax=Mycolicibacterium psychrotolerans TaxID=216929 RepID=UPI003D679204
MGKASRNRKERGQGAPGSVFPQFPYERKFTRDEIHNDILPRAKAFGDLMRDGMGPNGSVLYLPADLFELWMIHGVLAGADGGKAYIRSRPAKNAMLEGGVEWVLLSEDTPEMQAEDVEAEADLYLQALQDRSLRPEVRAAIRRRMRVAADDAAEFLADDPDADALRDGPRDFGAPRLVQFTDADTPEEGDA